MKSTASSERLVAMNNQSQGDYISKFNLWTITTKKFGSWSAKTEINWDLHTDARRRKCVDLNMLLLQRKGKRSNQSHDTMFGGGV